MLPLPLYRVPVALILVLGTTISSAAQTRATSADLIGVVRDASGLVVPGASVTATHPATNAERTATTDRDGRYTIPALPPGRYRVVIEHPGFVSETWDSVLLELGTTVTLDALLQVAGAAEAVTVRLPAPVVDTQETSVATVVSERQIESLPIDGRHFIGFSVLTPGVSTDRTPQQGASATSGLTFSGQRARSNNIMVDGLDNNDPTVGGVRATFSQEAVREFQVVSGSYSAEFGKAAGGLVNIVTKSGTNTPAGSVFFYVRDDALNARNHFEKFDQAGAPIDVEKAPYTQRQYGGSLGGPLVRDRTFFFGSFERLDIGASNFVTIDDTTPVSVLGASPCADPSARCTTARLINDMGFPVEVGHVPYRMETNTFLAKVDHQIGAEQALAVRYNYGDGINENVEPFGGLVARSRAALLDSSDHVIAASYLRTSSRTVNELRFQYARRDQQVNALDPRCGGPCLGEGDGGPTVEIVGAASFGRQRFTPQPRLNERYQVVDTLTILAGRHQMKAGFDFNYIDHLRQALPLHFGGRYVFTSLTDAQAALFGLDRPLSSVQAFALGLPVAYVQGYGNASLPYTYSDLSLFVQDDWRPADHLTVKLGLRYQRQFWPDVTYAVNGVSEPFGFPSDSTNFAPRLALAWDPGGDGKTNVHGAWGLFFDNHITGMLGIAAIVDGADAGLRTLVAPPPLSLAAWRAPGRRLPEAAVLEELGGYPSLQIAIDPGLETPYARQASLGVTRELAGQLALAVSYVHVRGFNQVGTIDYNPLVATLGPGRRPLDRQGVPGTSASVLQYTSYGRTWYHGLSASLRQRFNGRTELLASYTWSKAEDDTTDFQTAFLPERNGRGRDPADPAGLPLGFDPDRERGPSLQDQRHRLVVSGLVVLPGDLHVSSIVTVASGRPFPVLAGADLNQDGDGGAFPADRPRTDPANPNTSIGRNAGRLPAQATVDLRLSRRFPLGGRVRLEGLLEVFNLFNRANFTDVQNIFGPGPYPGSPLSTFGQHTQAGPPLQMQVAARVLF